MGSGFGDDITVTQDAQQVAIVSAFFSRGDLQPPLTYTYALDGSASTNTLWMGRGPQTQTSRATWEGQALVIRTTHTVSGEAPHAPTTYEVTQRLTLESPSSLMVDATRAGVGGSAPSTTRTSYRRVQ
jgi:hypothetical protein